MSWARSPAGKAILAVLAIYIVMIALVFGLRAAGLRLGGDVRLGMAVAFAVPIGWFVLTYWKAIDEAAREAQKWAWFWGAGFGMTVAMVAMFWRPHWVMETFALGSDPADLLHGGAMLVVGAQLVGFFAAWAYWWGSRR